MITSVFQVSYTKGDDLSKIVECKDVQLGVNKFMIVKKDILQKDLLFPIFLLGLDEYGLVVDVGEKFDISPSIVVTVNFGAYCLSDKEKRALEKKKHVWDEYTIVNHRLYSKFHERYATDLNGVVVNIICLEKEYHMSKVAGTVIWSDTNYKIFPHQQSSKLSSEEEYVLTFDNNFAAIKFMIHNKAVV